MLLATVDGVGKLDHHKCIADSHLVSQHTVEEALEVKKQLTSHVMAPSLYRSIHIDAQTIRCTDCLEFDGMNSLVTIVKSSLILTWPTYTLNCAIYKAKATI